MPISLHNPFTWRQHPGEVIVLCVRWYLRYPLSYEHVAERWPNVVSRWMPVFGAGCRLMHPS
jgi:transposase-like protein